jgi:hypothetical protein
VRFGAQVGRGLVGPVDRFVFADAPLRRNSRRPFSRGNRFLNATSTAMAAVLSVKTSARAGSVLKPDDEPS